MTWKYNIFKSSQHGGYLVGSGFFVQIGNSDKLPKQQEHNTYLKATLVNCAIRSSQSFLNIRPGHYLKSPYNSDEIVQIVPQAYVQKIPTAIDPSQSGAFHPAVLLSWLALITEYYFERQSMFRISSLKPYYY